AQADIGGGDIVQVVGGGIDVIGQHADAAGAQDGGEQAGRRVADVVVGEGFRLQVIFLALHREVGEQRIQGEESLVFRLPLHRAGQAQALFMVGDVVI